MRHILLLIFVVFSLALQAQQKPSQITMMTGRTYDIKLRELQPPTIQFEFGKKHKIVNPAIEKVFSVTDSTGKKTYIYSQDSLYGNYFAVKDMENFIKGYDDGRHYVVGDDFAVGFMAGFAGSYFGPIYGWGVPLLATTINVSRRPKPTIDILKYSNGLQFDSYYLAGMRRKVRARRMWSTVLGSAVGMIVGTVVFQTIVRSPSDF